MANRQVEIPTQILEIDYFLKFFATNSLAQPNINYNELSECINALLKYDQLPEVDISRLGMILDKLVKDELVTMTYPSSYEYAITYEGSLTHLLGGYSQKYLESHHQILSKRREDKRAIRLFWINFWIAVGSLAAALYYLTKLYWEHSWFHYSSF
jgi:hypothetical protein